MKRVSLILSLAVHASLVAVALYFANRAPTPTLAPMPLELALEEGILQYEGAVAPMGNSASTGSGATGAKNTHPKSTPSAASATGDSPSAGKLLTLSQIPGVSLERALHGDVDLGQNDKRTPEERDPRGDHTGERGVPGGPIGDGSFGSAHDGFRAANGMNLVREGFLLPFFRAVWAHVDSMTVFPAAFAAHHLEGKVTAQLEVDRRGVFTGNLVSLIGNNAALNTFALATLIQALHDPLRPAQWRIGADEPETLVMVFSFDFALLYPTDSSRPVEMPQFKNMLSFRREAHVDSLVNKVLQVAWERIIPVIPIPGGLSIDFLGTYRMLKRELGQEVDARSLTKRLEISRAELDAIVRHSASLIHSTVAASTGR